MLNPSPSTRTFARIYVAMHRYHLAKLFISRLLRDFCVRGEDFEQPSRSEVHHEYSAVMDAYSKSGQWRLVKPSSATLLPRSLWSQGRGSQHISLLPLQCGNLSGIPSPTGILLTQRFSHTQDVRMDPGGCTRRKHCLSTLMCWRAHVATFNPVRPPFSPKTS